VTAYRLGKTCVVGCRELRVNEKLGVSAIQDRQIKSGDWLGIDGHNGFIYMGRHETMPTVAADA
jgi:pyruvate,orthophosphate dikinase